MSFLDCAGFNAASVEADVESFIQENHLNDRAAEALRFSPKLGEIPNSPQIPYENRGGIPPEVQVEVSILELGRLKALLV